MSRLEELIQELCPNGVEYKEIKDIANVSIGEFVHKSKQNPNAEYPVFNGGITNTGFYDEFNRTANKIIISARGANAGFVNRVFSNFWSGNSCYTIDVTDCTIDWNFLYYWLKSKEQKLLGDQQKGGIPAVSKKQVERFTTPVPPLEVQREIVRILESFTLLTAELTAELTARKKQYEYYRNELLKVDDSIKTVALEEIADIGTGSSNTNEGLEEGLYPFYVRSQEPLRKNEYEYDETAIITAGDGVGVGKVYHYVEGKYALHQRAYRIHINTPEVLPKYYFHYMKSAFLPYIQKTMFQGSVPSIRRPMLNKFPVPVPSLEVQKKIIDVLENFESICNDLNIGLPAEIEARQKQYEFYRDKLLSFKQL
ncbi:hypothetical protein B9N56_08515 [Finegoldia magna]|uniref:Type I restriction modification DNA specificity domain-containing protein n=1 Tax=Finegoldia magna TaxID=1260 RepID=A0A233VWA2_FINMA|nr:restriction endonuclease subunit S [Finegoldia magna]OXZ36689.1 hypothetical protein B9N56_08515 [Finegoldia magna]